MRKSSSSQMTSGMRRGRGAGASVLGATMLPLLWAPLALGFMGTAGWIPALGGRSCVLPRSPGLRGVCVAPRQQVRATIVDDDAKKDAKLQELMDAFKTRQANGVNGESLKADRLEGAILRALGEADELLEARGSSLDATRKETKLHVIEDMEEVTVRVTSSETEIERALREADTLLEESLLKSTRTLSRLAKEKQEAEDAARMSAPPVKTIEEEEAEQRVVFAASMRACKNKADVVQVLAEMRKQGLVADILIANAAIESLAKSTMFLRTRDAAGPKAAAQAVELAKTILSDLKEQHSAAGVSYQVNSVTCTSFMALLARAAATGANNVDLDDGLVTLADMRKLGLEADGYNLASLLSLCANAVFPPQIGRLPRAKALFNEFKSAGVKCDKVVFNGLLLVCSRDKAGRLRDGFAIIDDMLAAGLKPDAYTFATMLDLVSRRGANAVDAQAVLTKMQENDVAFTTAILNANLKIFAKSAENGAIGAKEAAALVTKMKDSKVPSDVITFSTHMEILAAAVKYGKATREDAWTVINGCRNAHIKPTDSMYSSWIQVVSHEALNGQATAREGLDALNAIRVWAKGKAVQPKLYNLALDCVAKAAAHRKGSLLDGQEILEAMSADGLGMSAVSLSSFIQIAKSDHNNTAADVALQVYTHAAQSIKTQRVVTMMISCLGRAGQRKLARQTLEDAIDSGLTPNRFMFNAAMGACSKAEQVFDMHSRMQIAGIEGDAVTQKYLRLATKGKLPSSGIIAANKPGVRKLHRTAPPQNRDLTERGGPQSPGESTGRN